MARTGQLIAQRGDGNADGTDIRYWRRALEQVWDETTEDVRQLFMEKAAARASRINRYDRLLTSYRTLTSCDDDQEVTSRWTGRLQRSLLLLADYRASMVPLVQLSSRLVNGALR